MRRDVLIVVAVLGLVVCAAVPMLSPTRQAPAPSVPAIAPAPSGGANPQVQLSHVGVAPAPMESAPRLADPSVAANFERGGDVMVRRGDLRGALVRYTSSVTETRQLLERAPKNEEFETLLAVRLDKAAYAARLGGNSEQAVDLYRERLVIVDRLVVAHPTDLARHHAVFLTLQNLGDALLMCRRTNDALAVFQNGLAKAEAMSKAETSDAMRANVSIAHGRVGRALLELRRFDDARGHYQQAQAIAERVARANATEAQAVADHAAALTDLGTLELAAGKPAAALAYYDRAYALRMDLAEAQPRDAQRVHDLARICEQTGRACTAAGDHQAASARMAEALAHVRRLAEASGGNVRATLELVSALERAGDAALAAGDAKGAIARHREGLTLVDRLADTDQSTTSQRMLALAHARLGRAVARGGDQLAGVQSLRKAVEIHARVTKSNAALADEHAALKRDLEELRSGLPR